ncbi:MAG: hypothetical protein AAF658_19855, partial [Myxococcota bacterium]
ADGKATRFGKLQAIFQDYYQQTRAGEIAADRGAYLAQGTHEYTGLVDMMLGTTTNFNAFADSAAEKHEFMATLTQRDEKGELTMLKNWVNEQRRQMTENAQTFNVPEQLAKLECVTHPPSLPRVLLGVQFTDRFRNPDSPIHALADLQASAPVDKTLDVIRALHHAKHKDVTRYVDPRGFDRADAVARVSHGILYHEQTEQWDRAIAQALETFDAIVDDKSLIEGSAFTPTMDALRGREGSTALHMFNKTPMEGLSQHIITRLESALERAVEQGDSKMVAKVESRLEDAWEMHRDQLERAEELFSPKELSTTEELASLLNKLADEKKKEEG